MESGDVILALIVAISSAFGAGVGGAVTGWINLRGEDKRQIGARQLEKDRAARELESGQRREQRDREREEGAQERELKEAARLVDEELRDATALLGETIYRAQWWMPPRQLSSDVYTRYRRVLALFLDDTAWSDVSLAYQECNRVNWESDPGEPLGSPLDRIDLESVGISVVKARQALAPAAAPPDRDALLEQSADDFAAAVFPLPDDERDQLEEELRPLLEDEQEGGEPRDDDPPAT